MQSKPPRGRDAAGETALTRQMWDRCVGGGNQPGVEHRREAAHWEHRWAGSTKSEDTQEQMNPKRGPNEIIITGHRQRWGLIIACVVWSICLNKNNFSFFIFSVWSTWLVVSALHSSVRRHLTTTRWFLLLSCVLTHSGILLGHPNRWSWLSIMFYFFPLYPGVSRSHSSPRWSSRPCQSVTSHKSICCVFFVFFFTTWNFKMTPTADVSSLSLYLKWWLVTPCPIMLFDTDWWWY